MSLNSTSRRLDPVEPLVCELPTGTTPTEVFRRLSDQRHCLFLDSAQRHPRLGRYSYVAADPFRFLTVPADGREALEPLTHALAECPVRPIAGLPAFQGGAAGLLSYDLARSLEKVPRPRHEEFAVPALAMGLYDLVVAFDQLEDRAWIISQGWPEIEPQRRQQHAHRRLEQLQTWLAREPAQIRPPPQPAERVDLTRLSPQFGAGA